MDGLTLSHTIDLRIRAQRAGAERLEQACAYAKKHTWGPYVDASVALHLEQVSHKFPRDEPMCRDH